MIWWQVYPLGFVGAEKELGAVRGEVAPAAAAAGVARPPDLLGRQRPAARPDLHLQQPRLRHRRLLPDRPAAWATTPTSTPGRGLPEEGRAAAARRRLQPCGPGLPAGRPGAGRRTGIGGRGLGVQALRHRRCDHRRLLRGPRHPRHPQPQLAAGAGARAGRDAALAAPRHRRLAAGRRVRRAAELLGRGPARRYARSSPTPGSSGR